MGDLIESKTLCTARRKNGMPCHNPPMAFSNVCRMHGGAAPQVKRAAQVRAAMASDRLMATLIKIAEDEAVAPAVRLVAIRDALDRAGITMAQQVEVEVKQSWSDVLDTVLVDVEEPEALDLNVEDAVIVVDEPKELEAARDAETQARDVQRRRRAARGKSPALAPTEQAAIDRKADRMSSDDREAHESFLRQRMSEGQPPRNRRAPGKRR